MKMIIVDDERISREGMLDFVDWRKDYGIEIVGTAANGQEGLELYHKAQPDIVLTDIKMPMMSGIELAEMIRSSDSRTRIILLSAYSDFTYAQKALKTKVDDYLLKPIEEEELRKLLDRIVAESMERSLQEDSRQQFLEVLDGSCEWCLQLRDSHFQIFILGKETERDRCRDALWLIEFHEGSFVGIAKYPREASEDDSRVVCMGAECCYAGRRVERPEDIRKSYNEAVLAQYIGTFWGLKELAYAQIAKRRALWTSHHADIQQEIIKLGDELRAAIRQSQHARVEAAAHRTMRYLWQNQGIDPSYIEDFLMSLAMRVSQELSEFTDMKASLWELRMSLHSSDCFHALKSSLVEWLNTWIGRVEERQRLSDTTIVERVVGMIEQQYAEDINLRLMAERVYLSPNYLGTIFRSTTGMYFKDYVASYRMKKATEYLLAGSDKVAAIGEAVGIPNTSYFSSLFKKTYGVTPKEYRRMGWEQQ